ncbi:SDR family NAD(P)-dependent oxidoreductase [Actinomadura madurae]|uniref:SDR family NAD(P)-dependent oxidoreductase n=1 Tax=Actinomadura madurae TaxID=1993 RepID=UPI0020D214EC|nr:SDR family oxidoreductase [Actinomadura madurae]MCP9964930.1 SDR family oxidoreductase [Actinomadura madurae]MCQ0013601.1 SDR family oxidoreductase [Actinomadura madurae]
MRGLQDKVIVVAGRSHGNRRRHRASARGGGREGRHRRHQPDRGEGHRRGDPGPRRPRRGPRVRHLQRGVLRRAHGGGGGGLRGIDGLFNVAADLSADTLGRDADLLSVPVEVWHRSLAVNLTGYFYTARHAVPRLLERGGGAIVNTISGLVLNGDRGRVSYGASKSGLLAMSKHIATRWGKEGIRCNVVAPGMVLTDNSMAMIGEQERAAVLEMLRSPRFGEPEDIAAAVTFLLSEDGSWINGQVLPVNGGTGLR